MVEIWINLETGLTGRKETLLPYYPPPLGSPYQYVTVVWEDVCPKPLVQAHFDLSSKEWIVQVNDGLLSFRRVSIPDYFLETALVNYAIYKLSQ